MGATISKKKLKIEGLEHYHDHYSIFVHTISELTKFAPKEEIIEHFEMFIKMKDFKGIRSQYKKECYPGCTCKKCIEEINMLANLK